MTTLRNTLSPKGDMQLLLPASEIIYSVDSFMHFHANWFQDTTWTFETKIVHTEIGSRVGLATVETMYREPERDGVPYFNRMVVTYGLAKKEGQWYVISDHASSIEKSTD